MKFIKLIEKEVKPVSNKQSLSGEIIDWMSPSAKENLRNHIEFLKKQKKNQTKNQSNAKKQP